MNEELISVIIPCFNRSKLLRRAVLSVLNQDYSNFELILVDDASTESLKEVEKIVSETKHSYLRHETNLGVAAARNTGIAKSEGLFLAFLDSDDEWAEDKLSNHIEWKRKNPSILISQTQEIWVRNGVRVNRSKKYIEPNGDAFKASVQNCCISSSSVMIKKELLSNVGIFDESFRACEDYELWLRISCKYDVGLVKKELTTKYAGHGDQLSQTIKALDKYRLVALVKTILNSTLNENQEEIVRLKIIEKLQILLLGAKKRSSKDVLIYENLIEVFQLPIRFNECRNLYNSLVEKLLS